MWEKYNSQIFLKSGGSGYCQATDEPYDLGSVTEPSCASFSSFVKMDRLDEVTQRFLPALRFEFSLFKNFYQHILYAEFIPGP